MSIGKKSFILGLILAWAALSAAPAGDRFVKVFLPDGTAITAELAATPAERELGLMFRDRLDQDQGMLFVFDREELNSFWMLNMKFPIDIIWLNAEKRIVHIEAQVPPCPREPCPSYPTPAPALYVLELQSGAAAEHDLKLYERLEFVLPRDLLSERPRPDVERP
jgi:uncharacterized membrane protein (UPF0127 family)